MTNKDNNSMEYLIIDDLEPLEMLRDDLIVKCGLVYAELVKNDAEHNALELEHTRVLGELYDIESQINYINEDNQ